MALDSSNGVLAGLNYTLGLSSMSTAGTVGAATLAATGTGSGQTYYIHGNMASGQAGACASTACTTGVSNTHTLTVTY